jgi:predicted transcriptional regulator
MIKETAEIVSAYLANNHLPENEIPDFIRSIYRALAATTSQEPATEAVRAQPAVSVKKSVTPAAVICLECGKKFSMLKRHLRTDHHTTPDEYRAKWGLPSAYPMVAPDYAARRSALAVENGLGHKTIAAATVEETPKQGRKKAAV